MTQVVHLPSVPEGFTEPENGSDLWSMTEFKLFLDSVSFFTNTLQANSTVWALSVTIFTIIHSVQENIVFMCHVYKYDTDTHLVPNSDFLIHPPGLQNREI